MSNRKLTNIPASVRVRLLNKARANQRPFSELLQYFAMERVLYRLSISRHAQKFILKGALMFTAWEFLKHRATIDIDMLVKTSNSVKNLVKIIQDICNIHPEIDDGIIFNGSSVSGEISQIDAEYSGVQIKFDGNLDRARICMKIDIGFGDVISPNPSQITYPTILKFPPPEIAGYTPETVIAEKFQTIVTRGVRNSRMKDFFDIWTLQKQMSFHGETLITALEETFSNRQTDFSAKAISELTSLGEYDEKEKQWQQFLKRNQFDLDVPNFQSIINSLSQFLSPLISARDKGVKFQAKWTYENRWENLGL